jgi:hypothetical protein
VGLKLREPESHLVRPRLQVSVSSKSGLNASCIGRYEAEGAVGEVSREVVVGDWPAGAGVCGGVEQGREGLRVRKPRALLRGSCGVACDLCPLGG